MGDPDPPAENLPDCPIGGAELQDDEDLASGALFDEDKAKLKPWRTEVREAVGSALGD